MLEFLVLFYVWCVFVHACLLNTCVHGVSGGKKRASEPQELGLYTAVSSMWMLRVKPKSSGRSSGLLTTEPSFQLRYLNFLKISQKTNSQTCYASH